MPMHIPLWMSMNSFLIVFISIALKTGKRGFRNSLKCLDSNPTEKLQNYPWETARKFQLSKAFYTIRSYLYSMNLQQDSIHLCSQYSLNFSGRKIKKV